MKLLKLQMLVLLAGTIFSWYTVYTDFARFYSYEGTLFKVQDCIVPNPVTTPCFYGAFAFLLALIWSWRLLKKTPVAGWRGRKGFMWLLLASTIFAGGNFGYVFAKFYANAGRPTVGCSGLVTTNPFTTPCFYGFSLFTLALIIGLIPVVRRRMRRNPGTRSGGTTSDQGPAVSGN